MNRQQLEHVIRAACHIADVDDLVILGSQAILGPFPDAPRELLVSMEVDVYPRQHPERAELIEGSIGELSIFHETFGYFAEGVAPETAVLPEGWEERLMPIRGPGTAGKTGWALEVHDLLLAKYAAGREKDRQYNRIALRHRLAEVTTLKDRLRHMPISEDARKRISRQIDGDTEIGDKTAPL